MLLLAYFNTDPQFVSHHGDKFRIGRFASFEVDRVNA